MTSQIWLDTLHRLIVQIRYQRRYTSGLSLVKDSSEVSGESEVTEESEVSVVKE